MVLALSVRILLLWYREAGIPLQTSIEKNSPKVKSVFYKLSIVSNLFVAPREVLGAVNRKHCFLLTAEKCDNLSWSPSPGARGEHPAPAGTLS